MEIDFKNRDQETKIRFLINIVIVIFLLLGIRLWYLQIIKGTIYVAAALNNQTRVQKILAPRGIIYDRTGETLVNSRISYNISVVPDDIKERPEVLEALSKIIKIPFVELQARLEIDPRNHNKYQYFPIAKDIDAETMMKVFEAKLDLPGVEVDKVLVRNYPYGEFASHLLGYIREINSRELEKMRDQGYRLGDFIGKSGLEKTYEEYIKGQDGGRIYEVDSQGRILQQLDFNQPTPGNNLYLTLDHKLQEVAEKALEDQFLHLQEKTDYKKARAGAVVALDPRNGNILAMVSKPGFDPNIYTRPISKEIHKQLNDSVLKPSINRAISSVLAPGSTFKPITVITALMENKVRPDDEFFCSGYDSVWKSRFKCWVATRKTPGPRSHGKQTIIDGLMNSCNMVMAELSRKVGPDNIAKYAKLFGFGKPTGLNIYPKESKGFVPTTAWKKKYHRERVWYPLETPIFAIGQGYLTATPIQIAQFYAAIANGGKLYKPQVIKKITMPNGETLKVINSRLKERVKISQPYLKAVREGLTKVVSEGTARGSFYTFPKEKYPVAGKTGTAQRPGYDPTGIFACYAPAHKPEIVVVVLIEQAGSGSSGAAPVARKILDEYFGLNKPTPSPPQASPKVNKKTITKKALPNPAPFKKVTKKNKAAASPPKIKLKTPKKKKRTPQPTPTKSPAKSESYIEIF